MTPWYYMNYQKKMEMRKKLHISKFHTKKYGKERKINQPFFFSPYFLVSLSGQLLFTNGSPSLFFFLVFFSSCSSPKKPACSLSFSTPKMVSPLLSTFFAFSQPRSQPPCSLISKAFYSRPWKASRSLNSMMHLGELGAVAWVEGWRGVGARQHGQ